MKLPFIEAHIVKSSTLANKDAMINAMDTILSGSVPELEQVALALHELKCGGPAAVRRKRQRALGRKILKLNETHAVVDIGVEACS